MPNRVCLFLTINYKRKIRESIHKNHNVKRFSLESRVVTILATSGRIGNVTVSLGLINAEYSAFNLPIEVKYYGTDNDL